MADYDYYEHGHSNHDPMSFRQGDTSAERSMTRGSHNSHASASASTRSWIYSNQMNPPPPPVERSSSYGLTSFHGPRPLPEPLPVRRRPVRCPAPAVEEEEREEDMHVGPSSLGMQYSQQTTVLDKGKDDCLSPTSMGNGQDKSGRGGRSLIGGLMSGLMRIPTALRIGGGGQKSKKRTVRRQGTFGTDGTSTTATGITTGNTLPRYLSNPSIGPSNPQFAHRLSIAVANGSLPPDASPSAFQSRTEPPRPDPSPSHSFQPNPKPSPPTLLNHAFERHSEPRPNFPTLIRVTPPSAEAITEEHFTHVYDEPPADHPQFESHAPSNANTNDARATVMVYNSDDSHLTITPPVQTAPVPRVSYASQPTPRASGQIQNEPPPPVPTMPFAMPPMSPPRGASSVETPRDILSPQQTSRYTMTTTMASHYDPSFASHLTPVERFFKGLYNLPWVARERVTIDYRPGDSNRAKIKVKGGVKRPMASWYRAVVSRSRRGSRDLDLLSNGTGSGSGSTSLGNSITPLASPTSRRSERSSNHNRYQSPPQNHRQRKRRRRATDPPNQRSLSPLVPGVYPYQYPPYPYTYPYGAYPPVSIPLPVNQTAPPRGSRNRHRAPKYSHGYAPYQPMPPPPPPVPQPMYFIAPSPPANTDGGQGMHMMGQQAMPQGPMQMSPVIMQYVPGAFNQDSSLASPPITPRRTAPQSS
ncbi:hypothetical protein BYT27DRAFT_6739153 [Phlegmacium glaucopus]|nr:hypothetical protein BYT27DRAFT_6739153 [Phlegmacium glaucopus]